MQFWPINLIPRYLGSGFNKKGKINEAASHSPRLQSSPAGESVREQDAQRAAESASRRAASSGRTQRHNVEEFVS